MEKATPDRVLDILEAADRIMLPAEIAKVLEHKNEIGVAKTLRKLENSNLVARENGGWRINHDEVRDLKHAIECARFLTGFYYDRGATNEAQYMRLERQRFEHWLALTKTT